MVRGLDHIRGWAAMAAMAGLPGCTTFDGMPRPVIAPAQTLAYATGASTVRRSPDRADGSVGFGLEDALARALEIGTDQGDGRRHYRDTFIEVQLTAIDGQYRIFRERLSVESKSTNLGLDLAILALTGTGAVVGAKAANALSASGAALTGAKAAFNRDLYFDKTLPALIASMDSRRLAIRTGIAQRMKQPIGDYPIAAAIADVTAYQDAASLDDAIDQITKSAVDRRDVAKAQYDDAVHVCVVEPEAVPIWGALGTYLSALTLRTKMDAIAHDIGITPLDDIDAERRAIRKRIGTSYCSKAAAAKLQNDIMLATGDSFP